MSGWPVVRALAAAWPADPPDRIAGLFDAHYERLYRLARRLSSNSDDACDLVQETFLRAVRSVAAIPTGVPGEEAWLVRVLINLRRDEWRRTAVRKRHPDAIASSRALPANPEVALVSRAAVWSALDRLSPRRRAIVVMHELEDLPVAAIASLLGITAITVRWHLSVSRRELARELAPLGERPNDKR
jgi:RNA polymerase sigma-70 factor (ECF subfamily)